MKSFEFTIRDEMGLHARPAGLLVKVAAKYKCDVKLKAPAKEVDAKRIMAVMSAGVKQHDTVTVMCEGADEQEAIAALQTFFNENL